MSEERKKRRRSTAALGIVLLIVGVFVFRLVDIQVVRAAELNDASVGKRSVPVVTKSIRGDIEDRNGEVLATTELRYDVQLSPKNVSSFFRSKGEGNTEITEKQAFTEIAQITGQSADDIDKIVQDALKKDAKSDFAYVKRSVDLAQLTELKKLNIPWVTFDQNPSRVYPNGAVGGNIVGFVGSENEAQAGIELSQDACLAGSDGIETYERGADGVALPGSTVVTDEVVNGGTVELTLDRDLQWQVQQAVNQQAAKVRAEWAMAIVMDAKTGEILAVGEDNSVDPNNVSATPAQKREARSYVAPYEPGSTFKTITAAALFDTGKATPLSQILTPGQFSSPDGAKFTDSKSHGNLRYTMTGVMVQSSNIGISLLGSQLSNEQRYNYLTKFGIGESTNSGMPLEDSGMLMSWKDWDVQTQYTTMFGQGVSSTLVQTAGVFQTIANGGVRIPPSLVKDCVTEAGEVKKHDSGKSVKVISPEAAATTTTVLENVAQQSWTAKYASIPGYRVAAKTGTAEQPDGRGGYRKSYVHTYAGFYPAENPQYVTIFSVAHPAAGDGGVAAASGFKSVAEATIKAFHVPPSTGAATAYPQQY
jgi:cell division protein FtsI (penicillin-binding protein 3)